MAIKTIILSNCDSPTSGYIRIAAIYVFPEIALEPDINCVCNVCGILDISSYPIKLAKKVINNVNKNVASITNSSPQKSHHHYFLYIVRLNFSHSLNTAL